MIAEKIYADQIQALRQKDSRLLGVLRLLTSSINYKKIDLMTEALSDEDTILVLRTEVKKRKESIEIYERVGDKDRTDQEKYELGVIESYLPAQMGEDEVRRVVEEVARETGKTGGVLIGAVMGRLKGKADGSLVAKIVGAYQTNEQ